MAFLNSEACEDSDDDQAIATDIQELGTELCCHAI